MATTSTVEVLVTELVIVVMVEVVVKTEIAMSLSTVVYEVAVAPMTVEDV